MREHSDVAVAPPTDRGRATRASLLAAAERLLAGGGFEAMTSTAVAEAAGVSTGTFYAYFRDKHALLAALFADRLDALVDAVEGVLTAEALLDDGLEPTLARAVGVVLAGYRSHAAVLRTALARVPTRAELRELYWSRHARSVQILERFVTRGIRAGLIRDGDPAILAHTVLILTQSLNSPILLTDEHTELVRRVRAELVRVVVAVLSPSPVPPP